MEGTNHIENLKLFSRFGKIKITGNVFKTAKKKKNIKGSTVLIFLVEFDREGIQPESICRTCVRAVESANKAFKNEERHQERMESYSKARNLTSQLAEAKSKYPDFKPEIQFDPHSEDNCEICDQDPEAVELEETPDIAPSRKEFVESPSVRIPQSEEPLPINEHNDDTPKKGSKQPAKKVTLAKQFVKKTGNVINRIR